MTRPLPEELRYAAHALTRAAEHTRKDFGPELPAQFERHALRLESVANWLLVQSHAPSEDERDDPQLVARQQWTAETMQRQAEALELIATRLGNICDVLEGR